MNQAKAGPPTLYVVKSVSDHRGIYNLGVCIKYVFITMGHVKRVSNGTQ